MHRQPIRKQKFLPLGLAWLVVGLAWAEPPQDEWSTFFMAGQRVGYSHVTTESRETSAGKQWIKTGKEMIRMKRLGTIIETETQSTVVEDNEGVVISFSYSMIGAGMNVKTHGYRVGDELICLTGGREQRISMPKTALGPTAIDREIRKVDMKPGATLHQTAFMAEFPETPVTVDSTVKGQEIKEVHGKKESLWRVEMTTSAMPGMTLITWVDEQKEDRMTLMPMAGLGDLESVVSTREEALQSTEAAEVFGNTLIQPSRAIDLKADSETYRVTFGQPLQATFYSGPEQEIKTESATQMLVTIHHRTIAPTAVSWTLPYHGEKEGELKNFLEPSTYIDSDATQIRELARQAVGSETNPVRAAALIENFVRGYIRQKDLNVAFATASETARSKEGDCTEHAVLAAALGRAVGLPTRVVSGLGYLSPSGMDKRGEFGFHMWAEAWVGNNQWVPMDAALNGFDVGHIAIQKTALQESNPAAQLAVPLLQLMANLKIDVVK